MSVNSENLLKTFPRGPYTTARTHQLNSVFEFDFHNRRIAESTKLMVEAGTLTQPKGALSRVFCSSSVKMFVLTRATAVFAWCRALLTCHGTCMCFCVRVRTCTVCFCAITFFAEMDKLIAPETLRDEYLDNVRKAVSAYQRAHPDTGEMKLTTLLAVDDANDHQLYVHVQALGNRPEKPVKIQVMGAPR